MTGSARAGMGTLIDTLRGMCLASTADYSIGTHNYFMDGHIEEVLDRHKTYIVEEPLDNELTNYVSGTVQYLTYRSRFGNWEAGTVNFKITDDAGDTIGTGNYTADFANGVITFTADQAGSSRYLTGYTYDMNAAAADLWRMKAAAYSSGCDFSSDNMRVNRGQLINNCLKMASDYSSRADVQVTDMMRDDTNLWE